MGGTYQGQTNIFPYHGSPIKLTPNAGAAASAVLHANEDTVVTLTAGADCTFLVGTDPTADADDNDLFQNQPVDLVVPAGSKISVYCAGSATVKVSRRS